MSDANSCLGAETSPQLERWLAENFFSCPHSWDPDDRKRLSENQVVELRSNGSLLDLTMAQTADIDWVPIPSCSA